MQSPNFFTENSPFLVHPLLTPERTAQETSFVVAQLGLPSGARILDVGCGFGRHSIALAEYGYALTGIDSSAAMIAAAKERARQANVTVDFQQVRAEDFVTDRLFAGAICLFTTLGQFSDTGDNSALVERVYQALKPGSKLIVEVPQRESAIKQLRPADRFGDDETYTAITRQYDAHDQTVTEAFSLVSPDHTRQFLLRYRLYSLAELQRLLVQAGFHVLDTYSDYTASPFDEDASIMIVVAEK